MPKNSWNRSVFALTAVLLAAAPAAALDLTKGAVFVQGDDVAGGNKIHAFARETDGRLTYVNAFSTGANGSGETWINEGTHSVVRDGDLLFVTNSGLGLDLSGLGGLLSLQLGNIINDVTSGSISVFQIEPTGLVLKDVKSTHGINPVTVARRGNLVVVVNEKNNSVQSYKLGSDYKLTPVSNVVLNTNTLHGGALAHPSDVVFSRDGTKIVIAERQYPAALAVPDQSWFIDVASINPTTGVVSNVVNNDIGAIEGAGSKSAEPFGLIVAASGAVVVTHGRYELPYGSYEATYEIQPDNTLARSSFVPSGGWDDCWSTTVASTVPGQEWYYEQSFFDSAIRVAPLTNVLGEFRLVGTSGLPVGIGGVDIASTPSSTRSEEPTFLYALNNPSVPGSTKIVGYQVNRATGDLQKVGEYGADKLPITAVGIAAR
ncbi:MAG: lactonase, 7-bladed beta-propeller family protein [Myxococcaceae bacterium]|nr:lactonase, 7-bladed beta-propeller family protein [Myxococcaceae bacterium]